MKTTFEIKGNKIFTTSNLCERQDVFEIVDKIPGNFYIWNIGENMGSDEWIPLAQDLKPGDKENFEINPYTLKAIRLNPEKVQILRKAANVGVNSLKTAEKALKSRPCKFLFLQHPPHPKSSPHRKDGSLPQQRFGLLWIWRTASRHNKAVPMHKKSKSPICSKWLRRLLSSRNMAMLPQRKSNRHFGMSRRKPQPQELI